MRAMLKSKAPQDAVPLRRGFQFARAIQSAFALTLVLTCSCGGSLYRVKPRAQLPSMPATVASLNLGSISVRTAPLLTDEESQELFESNLQLAGLLPVRVEISHNGGDPIELKRV